MKTTPVESALAELAEAENDIMRIATSGSIGPEDAAALVSKIKAARQGLHRAFALTLQAARGELNGRC